MTKHRTILVIASLAALLGIFARAPIARADIFQWEYINPANPSLGKQPSATLVPGGAGAYAGPGTNLSNRNLTKAYLIGVDLSPILVYDAYYNVIVYTRSNLSSANLSQADLSHTQLNAATLTGANLTGAEIRGANFDRYDQYGHSFTFGYGTGLTISQLMSTDSFAAHDLRGISLGRNNLAGMNLSGFNLTEARFADADLTNVDFSNADLTGASISGTLTGMSLNGAEVRGASLWGVTKAQLYSTASYQAGDLTGIYLYSDQSNWNFAGKDLSQAQFQSSNFANSNFTGANLTGAYMSYINFQNANLSDANLAGANFSQSRLTGANLTDADVRGANFYRDDYSYPGSGLTAAQLVVTASYQSHDLTGIKLGFNNLAGVNFADQNLTNVDFQGASLEGANLTGADVRGASFERYVSLSVGGITAVQLYSTASYQTHDLSGINLAGANLAGTNLSGQNLTQAVFESVQGYGSNLSGANLSQANLSRARLGASTLAGATLIEAKLTQMDLQPTDLTNADLTRADLSNSSMASYVIIEPGGPEGGDVYHIYPGTNLTGSNLSGANLVNADFSGTHDYFFVPLPGANLTNANLSGADTRGASFQYATFSGANMSNLIQSDGHIAGLDLTAGASLVVRDYDGNPAAHPTPTGPLPIVVDQHLAMDATGTLRLVFDADPWDSLISFTPGIPVARGGMLELTFAPDVNLASQIGRTIDLFNWTGVTPTGAFTISSPYTWNLSNLYTTGEVTLTAAPGITPGDFNLDGTVDAADYIVWRKQNGTPTAYAAWRSHFGQSSGSGSTAGWAPPEGWSSSAVPEPKSLALFLLAAIGLFHFPRGCGVAKNRC